MKKEEIDVLYQEQHRILVFNDHHEVRCEVAGNVYKVYSENGSIETYCPGCGDKLFLTKEVYNG